MKRITSKICVLIFAALCFMLTFGACDSRDEVLKIYNWGEYMDPEVYEGFEDWYYKETGKTIRVQYKEFDTNESMYTEISVNKSDYDLACPSDYMIQRMINEGLVLELDKTVFDVDDDVYYEGLASLIRESFDPELKFCVPYVWGTFGIMYDSSKVDEPEDMTSWNAMFSEKYKGEILMKNSVRDAYSVARIYDNTELLSVKSNGFTNYGEEYKTALRSIFETIDNDMIAEARETLVKQKKVLIRYEVDDGKDDMLSGNTSAKLGFFWSCDAGYVMNDTEIEATGCSAGRVIPGNKDLRYVVPKEGANVWVDGFVIPKYSRNPEAANYFLKYLCTAEYGEDDEEYEDYETVAEKNTDWLGASTAVKTAMDNMRAYYEEEQENRADEESFFYDTGDDFYDMYMNMMFPTSDILDRCAIMKDFGKFNFELDGMWIDVKTA